MAGGIFVGTGGWTFEPWRGVFYPEGFVFSVKASHFCTNRKVYHLARKYGAAIVFGADDGDFPEIDEPTADFVYARLMGTKGDVETGYSKADLDKGAKRAKAWSRRGDTFVYVISGAKMHNPAAAMSMIERISP